MIAGAFADYLDTRSIAVKEYDIFAGVLDHHDIHAPMPHTVSNHFDPLAYSAGMHDPNIDEEIENCRRTLGKELSAYRNECLEYLKNGILSGLLKRWAAQHIIPGYERVVKDGYAALEQRILESLQNKDLREDNRVYLKAMLITIRAAKRYVLRYVETADEAANNAKDADVRSGLMLISEACKNLSEKGASSFFEAIQSVILFQEMIVIEQAASTISYGRLDQLLFPYYRADLKADNIDAQQASRMIEALWLKIGRLRDRFQTITLFGCDENGEFAGNEIPLMMRASRKFRHDQPLLSL